MKHLRCVTIAMTTHVHKRFHVQPLQQWNRVRHADQIRKVKLNVLAPVFKDILKLGLVYVIISETKYATRFLL